MTFNELKYAICYAAPEREYLLYSAGFYGLYHLGETDVSGLYLIDATPEQILEFVQCIS